MDFGDRINPIERLPAAPHSHDGRQQGHGDGSDEDEPDPEAEQEPQDPTDLVTLSGDSELPDPPWQAGPFRWMLRREGLVSGELPPRFDPRL